LVGKKIVIVANLEPRKLRGVMSHGMLLAASNEDKSAVVLLTLDRDVPNGSKVS
jgi:methionyl-tRNA synthetase